MKRTPNFSSSPADERLLVVPLEKLLPHPANANLMSSERLQKLEENIRRERRYPPIVVRDHPDVPGSYQVLDGHQRLEVLHRLGLKEALCFPWPCDDETALILLATLNRLEGEDVPAKRAELLAELTRLIPAADLAALLPENEQAIHDALDLLDVDADSLLAQLTAAAEREQGSAPRLISFVVLPEDEPDIELAIDKAMGTFTGANRRGRALGLICREYLGRCDG